MNPDQVKAAVLAWQSARTLHQAGKFREAEPLYRKALQAMPRNVDLLNDYGRLAEQLNDWRAAENIWRATQQLAPERAFGDRLGLALLQQQRPADALPVLESHRTQKPDDAASLANLAYCLNQLGREDDAINVLQDAVRIRPTLGIANESLITLLINAGRREEAGAALANALRVLPNDPEFRYMDMEHRLKSFDFAGGFDRCDARWITRFVESAIRGGKLQLPRERLWDGQPFAGRLLVRAEQGVGDELIYSSLLADLAKQHANTVIDCDARLIPLFARSYPSLQFIPRETPEGDPRRGAYDRQCLMGDLPKFFRRCATDFPTPAGWLQPDITRRDALQQEYISRFGKKLRIGISWRSANPANGDAKSLQLDQLLPLLTTPGTQFISLQYGETSAEIDAFAARSGIHIYRDANIDATQDLDGLAAQICALDLVISTSNSTVHLAGALGAPTWVLLHRDRGLPWYWGYEGESVPWYPRTTLLRCPRRGHWAPIVAEAATRLAQRMSRPTSP